MSEQKALQTIAKTVKKLAEADELKKQHTNSYNAIKTELKTLVVKFIKDFNYPLNSAVRVGSTLYRVAATEQTVIPAKEWYELFQAGEITEHQFLAAISVSKTDAKNSIGADQVAYLETVIKGKTQDLRIEASKANYTTQVEVIKPIQKLKKRLLLQTAKTTKNPHKRILRIGE